MGRILGVDLGTRRVGLALSDPLRIFGSPLETVPFSSETSLVEKVTSVCVEHGVDLVVVGMPYEADGSEGKGCVRARRFAARLEAHGLKTALHDETWTSRDAEAALNQAHRNRRTALHAVDRIAASLILRDYLQTIANAPATDT